MPKVAGTPVLVAVNNPVERSLICSYLESLGIFPDSAAHGRETLDACRSRAYVLIFLECRMPGMDGFAAVHEIRVGEAGKGKRVYIVGVMDRFGEDGTVSGLPHGMDALIIKPLNPDVIKEYLQRAILLRGN
jgi:CheY-like chemotaxis protein